MENGSCCKSVFSLFPPLAGSGRILRGAKNPSEGLSPRAEFADRAHHPHPLPARAGRGCAPSSDRETESRREPVLASPRLRGDPTLSPQERAEGAH